MTVPAIRNAAATRDWLNTPSPLFEEMEWLWEQNEIRFEGMQSVLDELWRFDWETLPGAAIRGNLRDGVTIPNADSKSPGWSTTSLTAEGYITNNTELAPGEHYGRRQRSAIYVNLMEAYATDIVGHLFRNAPAPDMGLDFGTLGIVRRIEDIDEPTRAELLYYNTDGVGSGGSQWDSFWSMQLKLAMATGFRWIYVDVPNQPAKLRLREKFGFRPYLVGFSPRQVINHHYSHGQLEWAVVKLAARRPKIVNGAFEGNDTNAETLLLVRKGNTDLNEEGKGGIDFSEGGWWRFDSDGELIEGQHERWDSTGGEIPMAPLIYDRHDRLLGRPGLTELGNASIALMNVQSAADFDAYDSAGSVIAVRGADKDGYNLFIKKVREGNRYAPLPVNTDTNEIPDTRDATGGVVAADVFDKRITAILKSADRIRGTEQTSGPQVSGLAQQAGFTLGNVPRLALVAANLETCQNNIIAWAEQRWTRSGRINQSGSARWSKKFELVQLTSAAQAVLQLEAIAGVHSEELEVRAIVSAAQHEGFVPDNQAKTRMENEIRASAQERDRQAKMTAEAKSNPQVPGARSRNMPPEPAQTNDPVKSQMDGPNVE